MEKSRIIKEENLYEHFNFEADAGQKPLRVDKFLINRIENLSRNKIQMAAKSGFIFVNEISVKPNYKIKPKDIVKVTLPHPPYENLLKSEKIPLNVVFEDDHLIVINKEAGLVVHPGHGNYSGTLVNALLYHFKNLPLNSNERPGLVHRLDKDTSGLILVAKSDKAMKSLANQFYRKTIDRTYQALVWGNVQKDKGTINANISRDLKNRLRMFAYPENEIGKTAITHYKVIERFGYVTLLECNLETGRTHQIRVHMKHIGHTLFNDERYGGNAILKGTKFSKYKQFVDNCFKILPRQALHAKTIGFNHPVNEKKMKFTSGLPDDISEVLKKWRIYSKHKDFL